MTEVMLTKGINCLLPTDDMAKEALTRFPYGRVVKVSLPKGKQRSVQQLRMYWALVGLVLENQQHYRSREQISDVIKIGIGHCDTVHSKLLGELRLPKSISFGKMTQDEANAFMDRAIDFVLQEMLPGLGKPELQDRIFEIIGAAA